MRFQYVQSVLLYSDMWYAKNYHIVKIYLIKTIGTEHSKSVHSHTHKDGGLMKTVAQLHITVTTVVILKRTWSLLVEVGIEKVAECELSWSGGRKLVTPDVNRCGSSHTPWTEIAVRYWRCMHGYVLCIPTPLSSFLCSLRISHGWNCA